MRRREFLKKSTAIAAATAVFGAESKVLAGQVSAKTEKSPLTPKVWTVLGPIDPDDLGLTLMHEHAAIVDWSELYETPAAPFDGLRDRMLSDATSQLDAFRASLEAGQGTGAIVECTPIRVGRYPSLLLELAQRAATHIIACTGFWCEAMAPQHPWALKLTREPDAGRKIAELYIREIREGMEDPAGAWGEKFTNIRAGIIKVATSTFMRPSERRCHEAAAIASSETGCPITTHTTDGGGLEEARFLGQCGAHPDKIIIGHQGNLDDRNSEEAHDAHLAIAELGCYVQFDRVGHAKYELPKIGRQIRRLFDAGHGKRVLVGHDLVPFVYSDFSNPEKRLGAWTANPVDLTTIPKALAKELSSQGLSNEQIHEIYVENPKRVLAF